MRIWETDSNNFNEDTVKKVSAGDLISTLVTVISTVSALYVKGEEIPKHVDDALELLNQEISRRIDGMEGMD